MPKCFDLVVKGLAVPRGEPGPFDPYPKSMETWTDARGWRVGSHPEVHRKAQRDRVWLDRTVAELAASWAIDEPDRVLIIDGHEEMRAGELYRMAQNLAGALVSLGIKPGEVVSFQLPNWWEAAVINLACAIIGAVVNPITPISREAEISHIIRSSGSRTIFIPHVFRGVDHLELMARAWRLAGVEGRSIVVRGEGQEPARFEDLIHSHEPVEVPQPYDARAVKLLMYTSGTTGRPKGVLHGHSAIHADGLYMSRAMNLARDVDVVFCPSPVTHISGYLWVLNMPWLSGIPAVSMDQWDQDKAFELLDRWGCSVMIGATPFLHDLVTRVSASGKTLPKLRHYVCGGAAVPPSLIYRAAEVFPNCIPWRTFGSTETTTLTRGPRSRDAIEAGAETDGQLCFAEAKLADPVTGVCMPEAKEGELLVRGPGMMLGYVDPADNAAAFDADGYFRMGDLVRIRADGHLICIGRLKDLIIRAGENISAKEIEDVLTASDRIAEAAVVSMPHPRTGEAICAFLVMAAGQDIASPEVDSLFRAARLARQKTPEHLIFVDELPRTPAGKVRKDVLRDRAREAAKAIF